MKITTITLYHVDGAEVGLNGLEPYVTQDREKAEQMERLLTESANDGRLTLALSDQFVYGCDGVALPGGSRLHEGYPPSHWSNHFDRPAKDSVDKLVGRCSRLQELLAQKNPEVAAVLYATTCGKLAMVGSYHVTAFKSSDIVPYDETVLLAPTERGAREAILRWRPRWTALSDGSFVFGVDRYTVDLTCVQYPRM